MTSESEHHQNAPTIASTKLSWVELPVYERVRLLGLRQRCVGNIPACKFVEGSQA